MIPIIFDFTNPPIKVREQNSIGDNGDLCPKCGRKSLPKKFAGEVASARACQNCFYIEESNALGR